jgi:hypothetical protein
MAASNDEYPEASFSGFDWKVCMDFAIVGYMMGDI